MIGLPDPLPEDEWADAIEAVVQVYGQGEAVAALRIGAQYPTMRGWGRAQRDRAGALLAALERQAVAA